MLNYLQNSIQPDANNTMNSFASAFGLIDNGESLKASFDHLPVMQLLKQRLKPYNYINTLLYKTPEETKNGRGI
jgi:hypothetical protein